MNLKRKALLIGQSTFWNNFKIQKVKRYRIIWNFKILLSNDFRGKVFQKVS